MLVLVIAGAWGHLAVGWSGRWGLSASTGPGAWSLAVGPVVVEFGG